MLRAGVRSECERWSQRQLQRRQLTREQSRVEQQNGSSGGGGGGTAGARVTRSWLRKRASERTKRSLGCPGGTRLPACPPAFCLPASRRAKPTEARRARKERGKREGRNAWRGRTAGALPEWRTFGWRAVSCLLAVAWRGSSLVFRTS